MEGNVIEVNTINEALSHFGMGELNGKNLRNAHGDTNKGNHVWLPKFYKNDEHSNFIHDENNIEYILQIDKKSTEVIPDNIQQNVFSLEKSVNSKYKCEDLGKYQQVLYDRKNSFSVHVKNHFNPNSMKEESKEFYWDNAFFSSAEEAQKKADELFKTALEKSQKQQ